MTLTAPAFEAFTYSSAEPWWLTVELSGCGRGDCVDAVGQLYIREFLGDRWMVYQFDEQGSRAFGPLLPMPFPPGEYTVIAELHAGQMTMSIPEPSLLLTAAAAVSLLARRARR